MKLIVFLIAIASLQSFAKDCYEEVRDQYAQITIDRNYDYDTVEKKSVSLSSFKRSWDNFETEFIGDNVAVYRATSEYMSGFGIDGLVVDMDSCKILEVVQVYAE